MNWMMKGSWRWKLLVSNLLSSMVPAKGKQPLLPRTLLCWGSAVPWRNSRGRCWDKHTFGNFQKARLCFPLVRAHFPASFCDISLMFLLIKCSRARLLLRKASVLPLYRPSRWRVRVLQGNYRLQRHSCPLGGAPAIYALLETFVHMHGLSY